MSIAALRHPLRFVFARLGVRLAAAFGVVVLILLLTAGYAAWQLSRIERFNAEALSSSQRVRLVQDWSAHVRSNLERALTTTRIDAAIGDDAAARGRFDAVLSRLNEEMAATAGASARLQDQVHALSGEGEVARLIAEVTQARARFVAVRAQVRDDIQMGEGGPRIDAELAPLAAAMRAALDRLGAQLDASARSASADVDAAVARARQGLAASAAVAVLAAALLGWLTTRAITTPMRGAVAAARRMAAGDLSVPIEAAGFDECGQLLAELAQMQQRLQATLGDIHRTAEAILGTSSEVAGGSSDLSQRTEQTVAGLRQAATSIGALHRALLGATEAAGQADGLARSAADTAGSGHAAVQRVMTTMHDITARSGRIAEIVGIIDGIAFQTNILALNAAVEAARAGDQGRGFAVVASEVRALAHRSADSARQIKDLIDGSVGAIRQGASEVSGATEAMAALVDGVAQVSRVVGQIRSRSDEQGRGIGEVNQAVASIDHMTQQNAGLAERSAAAALALQRQAHDLAASVAAFRLAAGTRGAVVAS